MTPTEINAILDRENVPPEARAEPHESENAHVGAMVKWLAEESTKRYPRGNSICPRSIRIYAPDTHVDGWNVSPNGAWDTLTEALAHACGRIAKEQPNA